MSVMLIAVRSWSALTLDRPMWPMSPSAFIHAGDERGVDKAGADGVDADTAVGVVERGVFGLADLGVLGSDIAGVAGRAGQARARGDVHDRAEALLGHDLQLVLHREEHAAHVGSEHQVEGLHR